MANNKPTGSGIVYSTDPSFRTAEEAQAENTLPAPEQLLKIKLETKQRAGKAVTIIDGFVGTAADAETLGKKLKAYCGTGGSVKDNQLLVQGDNRDKIFQWLLKNGYSKSKRSG